MVAKTNVQQYIGVQQKCFFSFLLRGGWVVDFELKKKCASKSFCFAVNQLQDRILS